MGIIEDALALAGEATNPFTTDPRMRALQATPIAGPMAGLRAILEATGAASETGGGIVFAPYLENVARQRAGGAPSALPAPVEGGQEFLHTLQALGPERAIAQARHRWDTAPEQFPAQKFAMEALLDPTNLLTAGTGTALKGAGQGVRTAGKAAHLDQPAAAIGRALELLGAGAQGYDDAARMAVQGATGAIGAGLRHTPIPWRTGAHFGDRSNQALQAETLGGFRTTLDDAATIARQEGQPLTPGQTIRQASETYLTPKDADVVAEVRRNTGFVPPKSAIDPLLNEFREDSYHVTSAMDSLLRQGEAKPNTFADLLALARERRPASDGAWQEAVTRFQQLYPGERLTMARGGQDGAPPKFKTLLEDVLLERHPQGQVYDQLTERTAWLEFLADRYGASADALLPNQRHRAAEAVQARLAQEAPAPVAGGAVADVPPVGLADDAAPLPNPLEPPAERPPSAGQTAGVGMAEQMAGPLPWQQTRETFTSQFPRQSLDPMRMLSNWAGQVEEAAPGLTSKTIQDNVHHLTYGDQQGKLIGKVELVAYQPGQWTVLGMAVDPNRGLLSGRVARELAEATAQYPITSLGTDVSADAAQFVHHYLVDAAVRMGREVPPEVLAEYPALARRAVPGAPPVNPLESPAGALPSSPAGVAPVAPPVPEPPPTIPSPPTFSTDPLRAELEATLGRRLQEVGEAFGTRYKWDNAQEMPSRVQALDVARQRAQTDLDFLGLQDLPWEQAVRQAQTIFRGAPLDSLEQKAAKRLQDAHKRYQGIDLRDVTREDDALLAEYGRDFLNKLNGGQPPPPAVLRALGEGWRQISSMWRVQALMAPAYLAGNVMDAALKSVLLMGHTGTADLHGVLPRIWDRLARPDKTGQLRPNGVGRFGLVAEAEFEAQGIPRPSQLAVTQTQTEAGKNLLIERMPGSEHLVRLHRAVNDVVDESWRAGAYLDGYKTKARALAPMLADAMPATVRQQVVASGGLLTPKQVRGLVQDAGGDDAAVTRAYQALGTLRRESTDAGLAQNKRVHFDYQDTTNLDEMLRQVTGFHFYATRNIPLYAEILATHPGLWRALNSYDAEVDKQAKQGGWDKNPALKDTIRLPGATIARALFGQDGMIHINPLRYVSITSPLFAARELMTGQAQEEYGRRGLAGPGVALAGAQSMGVGLHPAISTAIAPTGIHGRAGPQNLLRMQPLVDAASDLVTGGQPAGGPVGDAFNAIAQYQRWRPGGGPGPSDPDTAVRLKLGELSLQETGQLDHPDYVAAMTAGHSNPLWQHAARMVARQQVGQRGVSNTVGLSPQLVTENQRLNMQAQAGLPQVNVDVGRQALDPVVPRPNYVPGTPMVSHQTRDAQLAQRAVTMGPAALMHQTPLRSSPREPGAPQMGASAQLKQQILAAYASATPAQRDVLLQDPNVRSVILQQQVNNLLRGGGGSQQPTDLLRGR